MRRLCVTLVRRLCDGYLPKAAEARYVNGGPSSHCIVWCIIAAAAPRRAWPQLHARAHVCVHTSTLVRAYTYRLFVSCSMQEPSVPLRSLAARHRQAPPPFQRRSACAVSCRRGRECMLLQAATWQADAQKQACACSPQNKRTQQRTHTCSSRWGLA